MDWALQLAKPFASLAGKSEKLQEISGWRRELMSQPVARSIDFRFEILDLRLKP